MSQLPRDHRALVLTSISEPLTVKTVPLPEAVPGSVVARVLAAPIVSYAKDVYNGKRGYPLPSAPFVPGTSAIARVVAVPPEASSLAPGQLVYVDPTLRARDSSQGGLIGLIGHPNLSEQWRDGCWGEYVRAPLENVTAIDEEAIKSKGITIESLAAIGSVLVAYGGLRSVNVKAGESVLIAPASGPFGQGAVRAALAMGSGRIVAMGRNKQRLEELEKLSPRVKTVTLTGDETKDFETLGPLGPFDVYLDISPPEAASSGHISAGFKSVRTEGRISLMGGILGDVTLPHGHVVTKSITVKGQWMYRQQEVREVVKMIELGLIPFEKSSVKGEFALEDWEKALEAASQETSLGSVVIFKP